MLVRYILPLLFARSVALSTSNITIDDEYGDSVTGQKPQYYSPPGSNPWAQGSTCGRCHIQLDPTQVHNGTWHDATYYSTLSSDTYTVILQFTGIAVYVYGVLANQVPDSDTETYLDFTLDDVSHRPFEHDPTPSTHFTYNALVFSKTGLDNTEHTLQILLDGPLFAASLFLFDYAVYTVVDEMKDSSSSSAPPSTTSTTSSPPVSTTSSTSVHMPTTNITSVHTLSPHSTLPPSTRSSSSTSPAQSPSSPASPSQHKNPPPVRIVIGVVVGGTALAIGIIVVALFLHRRRRSPLRSRVEPWRLSEKGPPVLSIGGAGECAPSQRSRREPTPLGRRGDAGPSTSQPLPPATVVSNLRTEITALREVMERLRGILGAETGSLPPPLYEETTELERAI